MAASASRSSSRSRTPTAGPKSPANMLPCTKAPRLPNIGLISTSGAAGNSELKEAFAPCDGFGICMPASVSPPGNPGMVDKQAIFRTDPQEAAINDPNLTLGDIQAAADRLSGVAHRTPLLTSATLDDACGSTVLLKAESFQRGGSFKFRGAYNKLSQLSADERGRGVVAYSSGNHGGAVALASRLLGIAAVVVVPATGSAAKLAAIE